MKNPMYRFGLLFICVLMFIVTAGTLAAINDSSSFPSNMLGAAGKNLISVINSGDEKRIHDFIATNLSADGLTAMTSEAQASFWKTVYTQSGGFDVMAVSDFGGMLEVRVRARQENRWGMIYMFPDKKEPDKLLETGIVAIPDPELKKELAFPKRAMAEGAVINEIEKRVLFATKQDWFSGVVLVAKHDRIIFNNAYGKAEHVFSVPNNLETKFHLGSMNKMFTGIAIAQLVEAGRLRFADTLANVLPEYPNIENARKITIHHLLSHTAGLRMLFDNPGYDRRKKYTTHLELVKVFAGQSLLFEPGSKWSYSNEGFVVLGAVIEKITQQPYDVYIREHIVKPAGMENTDDYTLDSATPNLAVGYGRFEDDPLGMNPRRPNYMFLGWRGNACGGGYSNAPDLLNFSKALRGNKLLNAALTDTITTPKFSKGYGYGFESRTVNGKSVRGHGGGGPSSGINSDMKMFWDGSYVVIVLSNYDAPFASELCDSIVEFLSLQ